MGKRKITVMVLEETDELLEKMGKSMYRSKGEMIDWMTAITNGSYSESLGMVAKDQKPDDSGQAEGEVQR